MLSTICSAGETDKSSDVCRTASLSEMGHEFHSDGPETEKLLCHCP